MMEIAVSTEQVGTMNGDIFEILDRLHQAGFRYVDFNAGNYARAYMDWGCTEFLSDGWKDWIRRIRAHADGLGLRFVQSHNLICDYFAHGPNQPALLAGVDRAIEACAMLNAGVSVMHPVAALGTTVEESMEMNVRFFRERARLAKALGVRIAIENMQESTEPNHTAPGALCTSPEQLLELVERIAMDNVGICLDTGHANCMGEKAAESLLKYGKRLIALHINDNDGTSDQHVTPYTGTVDWEAFMQAYAQSGFDGPFTLETFRVTIGLPKELMESSLRNILTIAEWMCERIRQLRDDQAARTISRI